MAPAFSRIFLPFTKLALSSLLAFSSFAQPVFSQRDYDPNLNHFYMGRQIWTVEDNSPIINNKPSTAPGTMNGSLPTRAPLPKAGWQGYAPVDNPTPNNNLPKAHNSASQKSSAHANTKTGQKGRAGNLGSKAPGGINSYKPYATYSNPTNTPSPGADLNTSTHVKGSLLHWARRSPRQ